MIIEWANGSEIRYNNYTGKWEYTRMPQWDDSMEYRVKPKEKRWKWVCSSLGTIYIEDYYLNDAEAAMTFAECEWYVKLEPTVVEYDE